MEYFIIVQKAFYVVSFNVFDNGFKWQKQMRISTCLYSIYIPKLNTRYREEQTFLYTKWDM